MVLLLEFYIATQWRTIKRIVYWCIWYKNTNIGMFVCICINCDIWWFHIYTPYGKVALATSKSYSYIHRPFNVLRINFIFFCLHEYTYYFFFFLFVWIKSKQIIQILCLNSTFIFSVRYFFSFSIYTIFITRPIKEKKK